MDSDGMLVLSSITYRQPRRGTYLAFYHGATAGLEYSL